MTNKILIETAMSSSGKGKSLNSIFAEIFSYLNVILIAYFG